MSRLILSIISVSKKNRIEISRYPNNEIYIKGLFICRICITIPNNILMHKMYILDSKIILMIMLIGIEFWICLYL